MRSFTFITALLLCSLSWISVSGSESQTVEFQPGDEVTLTCPNISKIPTTTEWFRLINGAKPSCISSIYRSDDNASYCDGFQNRFEMSSNNVTIFLKIKRVDLSDSGLYFCGFYTKRHTVIAGTTHLNVQEMIYVDYSDEVDFNTQEEPVGMIKIMSVVLGVLTVFLTIVVIVLAVKIRRQQTVVNEEVQPERNKNLGSDELNYAALSFQAKPKRSRRPEREVESHVVYAATR